MNSLYMLRSVVSFKIYEPREMSGIGTIIGIRLLINEDSLTYYEYLVQVGDLNGIWVDEGEIDKRYVEAI